MIAEPRQQCDHDLGKPNFWFDHRYLNRRRKALKYVVLGAAGQLGRDLCPRLPGEVLPLTRDRAELTRPEILRATLTALHADVVVNCAAYNFVDRAESEPEAAFAVNTWGVRALADICREIGCTLVHFSTNYVFGLEEDRKSTRLNSSHLGISYAVF